MFTVFTTIIMCFTVLSGIYAYISLFISYNEVNVATQSVSRSDGGSAPRDDLYSPECQRRPCQLDELQRQIPSEDLVGHRDKTTRSSAQSDLCRSLELNHTMLVSSGQRRTAHPTESGFSQGFLLNLCH